MMIRRCNIVNVDSSTAIIGAQIGATGCDCSCPSCNGCSDCSNCPNLTIANFSLIISRAGVCPYTPLLFYPAYSLVGINLQFYIDSQLTSLPPGRYIGKVTLTQGIVVSECGQIEMQVGDKCGVFAPYTLEADDLMNDLNP